MNRRGFLSTAPLGALTFVTGLAPGAIVSPAEAAPGKLHVDAILKDPDAPVGGNPNGNVPIVAFLDYNCPYCRKTAPDLKRFVSTDGKVRLVYKDWPILAPSSLYGAKLALAAKYQNKYEAAHSGLMSMRGHEEAAMRDAVKGAGVDMGQLDKDLGAHNQAIGDLIGRNKEQANALKLQGTPVYLIGPYLVASALDYDGFAEVVARFRERIGDVH